jgi:hypothetical protein
VSKYYNLDLQPETIAQNGHTHLREAIRHLGPDGCFYKDDLYALNFAGQASRYLLYLGLRDQGLRDLLVL